MSILNRPSDGLLSVLLALRRALVVFGPQEEERLISLCAPVSVVPDGKSDMARKTLFRWKQLGLFEEHREKIRLSKHIATIELDDLSSLRAAVLWLVLSTENNPLLTGRSQETSSADDKILASDLIRAACWVLAQDPYSFPSRYLDVERLQFDQKANPKAFVNDVRWHGFVEWAPFLGIAWTAQRAGIVPDPAFAVRSCLDDIFGTADVLAQETFIAALSQEVPILDGGVYRLRVESEVQQLPFTGKPHALSPSLSLALLHLEEAEEIRLESRADAPQRVLAGRGGRELPRRFSHVVRTPRRGNG